MAAFSSRPSSRLKTSALLLLIAYVAGNGSLARADEGGASFWLLGTYANQAAIASAPGFSIDMTYYSSGANYKRRTSTSDGRLEEGFYSSATYLMLTPSYAFETPVLGGQLEFGVTVLGGNYSSTLSTTLVPPGGPAATLGPFMSRVAGIGPQLGYDFKLGDQAASLSAKSYYEFAGENRAQGWNTWLTLVVAWGPFSGKLAKGR